MAYPKGETLNRFTHVSPRSYCQYYNFKTSITNMVTISGLFETSFKFTGPRNPTADFWHHFGAEKRIYTLPYYSYTRYTLDLALAPIENQNVCFVP